MRIIIFSLLVICALTLSALALFIFFNTPKNKLPSKTETEKVQNYIRGDGYLSTDKTATPIPVEFHIKVVPWGDDPDNWGVHFTNNNWLTFEELRFVIDLGYYELAPSIHPIYNKHEAVKLAKELDTYDKCVAYNEKEELRLKLMREKFDKLPKKPKPKKVIREEILIK